MMYLLGIFLAVWLIGVVLNRLLLGNQSGSKWDQIRLFLFPSILSVATSVFLVRIIMNKSLYLIQTTQGLFMYCATVLLVACFVLLVVTGIKVQLQPEKQGKQKHGVKGVLLSVFKVLMVICFVLGLFFWRWSKWFVSFFGELTPEQFLFNLNSPLKGTSSDVTKYMSHTPLLYVLTLSIIFCILMFTGILKGKHRAYFRMIRTALLSIVAISMLVFGVNYSIQTLHLMEVYKAYTESSTYVKDNYVNPATAALKFPEKKRNLIHIYAESVESSFFSKELGGYMDENLMPELYNFSKTGVHFSDNDKMGGSHQTYGSSWSVAGVVNMECGVPLKIPMDGNSYGKAGEFLPGITNLGDVLEKQGYNQTLMFGSDAEFGGLDVYFTQHGKYRIFDVKEARNQGLIPQDYNVWWGFEDDKLFDFAKTELSRLNNEGKPFHFNMETADTHFPDGYVSPNLKRTRASQYADVIAYSDAQIAAFVKWVQTQPFYENTTIVITGDHLSMDRNFFKDFDPAYKRAPFNLFINAPVKQGLKDKNRQFSPLDMFPTIVSSIGVEIPNNRLGLGTDLFSGQPTIIERDGLEKFNEELGKRSNYYDTHFVANKKKNE